MERKGEVLGAGSWKEYAPDLHGPDREAGLLLQTSAQSEGADISTV